MGLTGAPPFIVPNPVAAAEIFICLVCLQLLGTLISLSHTHTTYVVSKVRGGRAAVFFTCAAYPESTRILKNLISLSILVQGAQVGPGEPSVVAGCRLGAIWLPAALHAGTAAGKLLASGSSNQIRIEVVY